MTFAQRWFRLRYWIQFFNPQIKLGWFEDGVWAGMTSKETIRLHPEFAPPKRLFWRQRWFWYWPKQPKETCFGGKPTAAYHRFQIARSIADSVWGQV